MAECVGKHSGSKKVVIGIDGSANCICAIESKDPEDVEAFRTLLDLEVQKVEKTLEEFSNLLKRLKLHGVVKSTQAGKPAEGILRVAKEEDAAVIITGTRGLGKLRRTLLGSVSDYLVHHSPVPVLVCRFKDKK